MATSLRGDSNKFVLGYLIVNRRSKLSKLCSKLTDSFALLVMKTVLDIHLRKILIEIWNRFNAL